MATSLANPIEQHITCNVCLELFVNPHALRCLHTYCYQCIQNLERENRIWCPECRQYTDLSDVKKDFKMESLITTYRDVSENDDEPQETVCDACEDSMKPVKSFCTNCEELLCADCSKAHTGMKATKNHKLITFAQLRESKKQEFDNYIETVSDEEREMDLKCTRNRELIENIQQAELGQMAEVNRLRQCIIDDVNSHHDSLLSQILSINQDKIRNLEQQGQMFREARQELTDKKQFLQDVSHTQDINLLTDTLKKQSEQLEQELRAIHFKLPRFDRNVKSSVQVVKGVDWNPDTSTRIEVAGTAADGGSESRYYMQSPRPLSMWEVAPTAAAVRLKGIQSSHVLVRNMLLLVHRLIVISEPIESDITTQQTL